MVTYTGLIVLVSVIYLAVGLDLPPDFKKCKRSELNQCLTDAIQDALPKLKNGLPEFNFAPLQPLNIPSITIGEGSGAVNVVQNFKNVNIFGLTDAKIGKTEAGFSKTSSYTFKIQMFLKEIRLEAEYSFNGRILLLPIVGNGNAFVTFRDNNVTCELQGGEFQKKGMEYLEVRKVIVNLEPGKIEFKFDNLFGGDERLGNEMNRVFNDNWKEIWEDVKRNYEEALEFILQDVSNQILKKVPYATLFPVD